MKLNITESELIECIKNATQRILNEGELVGDDGTLDNLLDVENEEPDYEYPEENYEGEEDVYPEEESNYEDEEEEPEIQTSVRPERQSVKTQTRPGRQPVKAQTRPERQSVKTQTSEPVRPAQQDVQIDDLESRLEKAMQELQE